MGARGQQRGDRRSSSRRPSTRKPRSGGGRSWSLLLWVVVLLAAVAVAGWFLLGRQGGVGEGLDTSRKGMTVETGSIAGDRAVRVVFPEWDGEGFVIEQRRVPSRGRPDEDLLSIMNSLCTGPTVSGAISAIPAGTRARAAFIDPQDQSVVLDFSSALVTGHPGGSRAEIATLTSILRTVTLNYPGTASCVILIDGAPVGTLAGHLDMSRSFDPRRWR